MQIFKYLLQNIYKNKMCAKYDKLYNMFLKSLPQRINYAKYLQNLQKKNCIQGKLKC